MGFLDLLKDALTEPEPEPEPPKKKKPAQKKPKASGITEKPIVSFPNAPCSDGFDRVKLATYQDKYAIAGVKKLIKKNPQIDLSNPQGLVDISVIIDSESATTTKKYINVKLSGCCVGTLYRDGAKYEKLFKSDLVDAVRVEIVGTPEDFDTYLYYHKAAK